MRTLDKTKSFATIVGQMDNGARYEQDGLQFDGHGKCVEDKGRAAAPQTSRDVRSTVQADPALHEQIHRQTGGQPGEIVIGSTAGAQQGTAAAPDTPAPAVKSQKPPKPAKKPKKKAKAG